MKRAFAFTALLLAAVTLSACVPAADWLRDQLDSGDATLEFTETGVAFNPGATPAYEVHITLRAKGDDLQLVNNNLNCEVSDNLRYVDCDIPVAASTVRVDVTGTGYIGSATYVRVPGSIEWRWAYTPVE